MKIRHAPPWIIIAATWILLLFMTAFTQGWSWQLYDETSWIEYYRKFNGDFLKFAKFDFLMDGRWRPLSAFFPFVKYDLLGFDVRALKIARILELGIILTLLHAVLTKTLRLPGLVTAFLAGFFLKSPPVLEQLKYMTISELSTLPLLLAVFLFSGSRRWIGYAALFLAALTKEPLALLLPIPAFLEKRWREAALAGLVSIAYVAALFSIRNRMPNLTSIPYSLSNVSMSGAKEILKGFFLDYALLIPFLACSFDRKKPLSQKMPYLLLGGLAVSYAVMVTPRTWGYTYIYVPVTLLLTLTAAGVVTERKVRSPILDWFLTICLVLFCSRAVWNWSKTCSGSSARAEIIENISAYPRSGTVASNCQVDVHGIGWMAGKADGVSCIDRGISPKACCANSALLAIGKECLNFDELSKAAATEKLKIIHENKRWKLFSCSE